MGGSFPSGEMCTYSRWGRRGAKKADQKASKQSQRSLGVAQLEKIRLHNQMMVAYRSGSSAGLHQHHHARVPQQPVPFAVVSPVPGASSSVFHQTPYHLTNCFEEETTDWGMVAAVQYRSNPPAPSLFAPQAEATAATAEAALLDPG